MTVGEKQTLISFNPIQDKWWNVWVWGGGKKAPYNFFFPVTSTNVGLGPKTFWLLVWTLLPHWCNIASSDLESVPNYWTWTKTTSQKKWFFWSNPYKIEVMITSLLEMLELPNFGHMTTPTI